ncbi:MAG: DEAD/DEAH box helicase [Lewinellaceae bacterium]|nr:DEAD/DEAH box helicase [Saprospiraceae bacterium]MCB9312389.1 DEAD/DEAH box helicase [Lewinellaceae bacterium]HRW75032.1 DEAD/DEAH box helicase [Saprospiraceae bacterium]
MKNQTTSRFKRKPSRSSASPAGGSNSGRPSHSGSRSGGPSRGNSKKLKKGAEIPHHKFIQAALPREEEPKIETRPYTALDLHPDLLRNITAKGYTHTTPIQDQAIEPGMAGRDILGIAQTGTGKTAAFLIPMIQMWLQDPDFPSALVTVPTRELALQVEEEFRSLTNRLGMYSATFIGGANINTDLRKLEKGHHLIVGTPGRLLDLTQRRALNLRPFTTLVLDEFDRMLDMGFINDVKKIIELMPNRHQTMLFSATIDKSQQPYIQELLTDPVTVQVHTGTTTAEHIEQDVIRIEPGMDKYDVLEGLLQQPEMEKVLVFLETKHRVDRLTTKLVRSGFKAQQIHGNKSQSQRQRALEAFKAGRANILVATDVAARGLDISDVTHVINFETPKTFDSYIHRIGRTGRAGKAGKAFTFVEGVVN